MSHFTVIVPGENPETLLAPYDEDLPVEPYIREGRDWEEVVQSAKEYYARAAESETSEPEAIEHAKTMLTLPPLDLLKEYTGEKWTPRADSEGFDAWSTANPNARWDWYMLGGRWANELVCNDGSRADIVRVGDLDIDHEEQLIPQSYISEDGQWHRRGTMGWFGSEADKVDPAEWADQYKTWLRSLNPDTRVYLYDCHI